MLVVMYFHSMFSYYESQWLQVSNILQSIFFCAQQEETQKSEPLESEEIENKL